MKNKLGIFSVFAVVAAAAAALVVAKRKRSSAQRPPNPAHDNGAASVHGD